ncbi:oxyanion-translocating ATPase [Actinobacteria bacterium IMCC26207]|nr:oxyanion-translocating ATPase [Actinobacteria bacterium IMCC26207]
MDPKQFLTTSGVIIVAGKGGVGKTAVSAALAMASSSVGLRTLIVEVEGKSGLASLFNSAQFSYSEIQLVEPSLGLGEVRARTVLPEDALLDYLKDHGLKRISGRLVSTGALDVVATAVPGISDILVLGKIKQLERSREFDLIIVDAPAAGHAITFLRSASGLEDAVKVGPINTQAKDVLALLNDPTRCRVLLVTSPEETPVNELIETAYSLEDEVGVSLGPVVVNGVLPELPGLQANPLEAAAQAGIELQPSEAQNLADAALFRLQRTALQRAQLDRMAQELPLAQLLLPYVFTSELGPDGLAQLSNGLLAKIRDLPDPSRS